VSKSQRTLAKYPLVHCILLLPELFLQCDALCVSSLDVTGILSVFQNGLMYDKTFSPLSSTTILAVHLALWQNSGAVNTGLL